jgi:hypothetical protein
MRGTQVVDVQVEMDLLLRPVGPPRGSWFGASWTPCRHSPLTITVCQSSSAATVPPSRPAPEGTLGGQIGGVEHDDLSRDPHAVLLRMVY